MPYLILSLIGLAIVLAVTAGAKDKKSRNNKYQSIFYGITAATLTFILLSATVYSFGYQAGSDKAKRDNRNDGVVTEPVKPN